MLFTKVIWTTLHFCIHGNMQHFTKVKWAPLHLCIHGNVQQKAICMLATLHFCIHVLVADPSLNEMGKCKFKTSAVLYIRIRIDLNQLGIQSY